MHRHQCAVDGEIGADERQLVSLARTEAQATLWDSCVGQLCTPCNLFHCRASRRLPTYTGGYTHFSRLPILLSPQASTVWNGMQMFFPKSAIDKVTVLGAISASKSASSFEEHSGVAPHLLPACVGGRGSDAGLCLSEPVGCVRVRTSV